MIAVQNAFNLAFSDMIRTVLLHTGNRYVIEKNSLTGNPQQVLSKDLSVIIEVNDITKAPKRLDPPTLDPNIGGILAGGPTWFDAVSGAAAVWRGESGKRETSGRLAAIKVEQADAPMDAVARDMELTVDEMLLGSLIDMQKTSKAEGLLKRLGPDFTEQDVAIFMEQDLTSALAGVNITKDTLRPQTAREVREDTLAYVGAGMLDPNDARWAILLKSGESVLPGEAEARRMQVQEIQLILAERPAPVAMGQKHRIHIRVLEELQDSPQWMSFTPDDRVALQNHWYEHVDMEDQLERMKAARAAGMNGQQNIQQAPPGESLAGTTQEPTEALPQDGAGMFGEAGVGGQPPMQAPAGAAPPQV
jgi:hypothetical protein